MRSSARALVTLLVLAGLSSSGAASTAEAARHCGSSATRLHNFHVETKWTKKVYATSEKAIVVVTVTIPAHEDPIELGITFEPPASVPAEGVNVWSALVTEAFPPPYGLGVTDAEGRVRLKIPLGNVKPGRMDATHYASRWTNQGGCPDIEEWGYKVERRAFTLDP